MTVNKFGYVRVSSSDQNEARQVSALQKIGIPQKNIYIDKQSGKDFNRPRYKAMLKRLKKNDVLYITSIDRLGRNYQEIQAQWISLTHKAGVDIVVLDMPLLDTRRGKDLIGTFIADLVLQILSFVAQSERENIRQRQAEGIAAAKSRGVKLGRPPNELPINFHEAYMLWKSGHASAAKAAKICGMNPSTFRYQAQRYIPPNDRPKMNFL